jgi:hypothetical protein
VKAERSDHPLSSNFGRARLVVLSSAIGRLVVGFFGGSAPVGSALGVVLAVLAVGLEIVAFGGFSAT